MGDAACVVIIINCGYLGASARALADAQEAIGEAFQRGMDEQTISDSDVKRVLAHCEKSKQLAAQLDKFRLEGLALHLEISEGYGKRASSEGGAPGSPGASTKFT